MKRKAPIHKIDLWDEAHKKKYGNYTSDNVKTIMVQYSVYYSYSSTYNVFHSIIISPIKQDAANKELVKRKTDHNGSLSADDYNEAFKGALAKKAKLRGYYDEKYWSGVNVCQGITFVGNSEKENLQFEVRMVKDNVEDVKDDVKDIKEDVGDFRDQMSMMVAFLAKKFPGENLRNAVGSPTENHQVSI